MKSNLFSKKKVKGCRWLEYIIEMQIISYGRH